MLLRNAVDSHQIFSAREQVCGVEEQEFGHVSLLTARRQSTCTILTVLLRR